jgi:hypothetical protein
VYAVGCVRLAEIEAASCRDIDAILDLFFPSVAGSDPRRIVIDDAIQRYVDVLEAGRGESLERCGDALVFEEA